MELGQQLALDLDELDALGLLEGSLGVDLVERQLDHLVGGGVEVAAGDRKEVARCPAEDMAPGRTSMTAWIV